MSDYNDTAFSILCVDDEPNILSALRRLLRPVGYKIRTAGSGAEALAMLAEESCDLVISDMRMPEMDGARLLAEIRNRHPEILRLLLTGYADMASTIEAINRGEILRYLSKPWDDAEILQVVSSALERKALERENKRLDLLTREQNEQLKLLNLSLEDKVQARTTELAKANERLKQTFLTSIKVFTSLIELRHPAIAGHSRRVADTARRLAKRLGLDAKEAQDVFVAGLLHDIGKIGLPDDVMTIPLNRLNGERLGAWRKHVTQGQAALMGLEDLREVARLVRHHHERFDGNGFPDGLTGLAIPMGARVLSVANDYDCLQIGLITGSRYAEDDALNHINQGKGSRYDPAVVNALFAEANASQKDVLAEIRVTPDRLVPGMVLARDIVGRDGVLLLAADYIIDENLMRQIADYAEKEAPNLVIYIRADRRKDQ